MGRGIESLQGFQNKSLYPGSFYSQMQTFKFLFRSMLAEMVLRHTDNLSSPLQHQTMSTAAVQGITQVINVVMTLQYLQKH